MILTHQLLSVLVRNNLLTSESAKRGGKPTTNTKFFCTTRTLAKCLRFSVIFCFLCWSRCFFWDLNAIIYDDEMGNTENYVFAFQYLSFFIFHLPPLGWEVWSLLDFQDTPSDKLDTARSHRCEYDASKTYKSLTLQTTFRIQYINSISIRWKVIQFEINYCSIYIPDNHTCKGRSWDRLPPMAPYTKDIQPLRQRCC